MGFDNGEYFNDCECIKETAKAILVEDSDGDKAWVPKSQIHPDSDVWEDGHEGTLVVTEWFSEQIVWE